MSFASIERLALPIILFAEMLELRAELMRNKHDELSVPKTLSAGGSDGSRRMSGVTRAFRRDDTGNFSVITVVMLIPVALGVGLAVDYSQGVRTRSDMQQALDAAAFHAASEPANVSEADRAKKLREAYAANSGQGVAAMEKYATENGQVVFSATAAYDMPTSFMGLARINSVPVSVRSVVSAEAGQPAVEKASFDLGTVMGDWNKVLTLYVRKNGSTQYQEALVVDYTKNMGNGYERTAVQKVNDRGQREPQYTRTCTVARGQNCSTSPAPVPVEISLAGLQDFYLEMKITATPQHVRELVGNNVTTPLVMKSNDTATAHRMFLNGVQVPRGQKADVFSTLKCNERVAHAWEDGGNAFQNGVELPTLRAQDADFTYGLTGKCAESGGAGGKPFRLTQ